MKFGQQEDTICALSTPSGMGAIAMVRISGDKAFEITASITKKSIDWFVSNKAKFSRIYNHNEVLDEVVITSFKNPHSFTGEDSVEIACHGSVYIQEELIKLLIERGCRLAGPGEFSLRAFLNKKMDLSQTEAVADLIASDSKASHKLAMNQMRGGFSDEIRSLRQDLLNFASLIELELDFSQEDVEFADRAELNALISKIDQRISKLLNSFQLGNALKNGVPVAIIGAPNAGKSTLLNALLNEEKAIVSDIAGTTRDSIEDVININGVRFRFIDTAGIRKTDDVVENLGIERAFAHIKKARIVLYLIDVDNKDFYGFAKSIGEIISDFNEKHISKEQFFIPIFNKADVLNEQQKSAISDKGILISAKEKWNINALIKELNNAIKPSDNQDLIVTNIRHFDVLGKSKISLEKVHEGLEMEIPGDLLAMDIREALENLGEITGEVSNDELLGNIFANFCIGK